MLSINYYVKENINMLCEQVSVCHVGGQVGPIFCGLARLTRKAAWPLRV